MTMTLESAIKEAQCDACGACGDGCHDLPGCKLVADSPDAAAPAPTTKPRKTRGPYNTKKKQAAAAAEAKAAKPQESVVGVIAQGVRAIRDARELQARRLMRYETKAEKRLQDQLWATLLFLQEVYCHDALGTFEQEFGQ